MQGLLYTTQQSRANSLLWPTATPQIDPELLARVSASIAQQPPTTAVGRLRAMFDDPEKRAALLGFGQSMLSASGWSDRPVTLGQAVASGMQGAQDAIAQRQQAAQQKAVMDLKMRQLEREAGGGAWDTDMGRQVSIYAGQLKSADPGLTDEQAQFMALEKVNARQLDLIGARGEAAAKLEALRDYYAALREGRKPTVEAETAAAVEKAKGVAAIEVGAEKKAAQSAGILPVLDEAEKLIPQSTGSFAGMARDLAGQAVGLSTEGAQASARLKVLGQKVLENIPRMEGPQSDRDVQMYREAAGQLGDPSVPAETRLAALQTIRALSEKYAAGRQQAATTARFRLNENGELVEAL